MKNMQLRLTCIHPLRLILHIFTRSISVLLSFFEKLCSRNVDLMIPYYSRKYFHTFFWKIILFSHKILNKMTKSIKVEKHIYDKKYYIVKMNINCSHFLENRCNYSLKHFWKDDKGRNRHWHSEIMISITIIFLTSYFKIPQVLSCISTLGSFPTDSLIINIWKPVKRSNLNYVFLLLMHLHHLFLIVQLLLNMLWSSSLKHFFFAYVKVH